MIELEKETTEFDIDSYFDLHANVHKYGPRDERLDSLYSDMNILYPTIGNVYNARYDGIKSGQHLLYVPGLKDYIRVDDKPSETRFLQTIPVGDYVDVTIDSVKDNNFIIKGSVSMIYEVKAREELRDLADGVPVIAHVIGINPAGYDINILHNGVELPAFMPNTLAGINKLSKPDSILGDKIEVMVESYAEDKGTYIVSRRRYLKTLIPNALNELEAEKLYIGKVTGTKSFGVFVEFNECLTGMIHRVNVVPEWRDRIGDIKPGQEIEFYIKEVVNGKIILTQILEETLWDTIKVGDTQVGVVNEVKKFGILVNLDESTVGLIHKQEAEKLGLRPEGGDQISVRVTSVDRINRRIVLST